MARRSLRPELNRIRAWVRQGRTDAWIAHQLEVTVQQIQAFKRDQQLEPGDETDGATAAADFDDEIDLRAEDDALIAAELDAAAAERADERRGRGRRGRRGREARPPPARPPRRPRRTRPRRRSSGTLEATFDHGEEGYGLWLDPAVQDDPVYAEYWAGHRPVEVAIEEDQIVIRRAGRPTRIGRRRRLGARRLRRPTDADCGPPQRYWLSAIRRPSCSRSPRGRSGRTPRRRRSSGPTPPGGRARPGPRSSKHQSVPCSM